MPDPDSLRVRLAARVILLDPAARVLLMRYDNPPPTGRHWATPGGGLEAGESYPEAARRELAEETGWTDITLLGEAARHERPVYGTRTSFFQRERLYFARTRFPERRVTGVGAMHAADGIAAWRWWTLPELDQASETVFPPGLADLIRAFLAGPGA